MMQTKAIDSGGSSGHGGLAPSFGLFSLTMLGVGATIGTGIFFVMAEAVPKAGPAVLLSFLLAGFTAGLTAVCYAELAASIPATGSSYSYAYAALGEFPAFIVAACVVLEYGLAASAVAIGWSGYLNNFLTNLFGIQIPEALRSPMFVSGENGLEIHAGHFNLPPMILVTMCGLLLMRGAKESATANAVMVTIKLCVLVFFAAIAFSAFKTSHFEPFFNESGMKGVAAAAGTVFFSFIGLDAIATAGAEVRNPKRNIPLGIVMALLVVCAGYSMVAIAALGAQRAEAFAHQDAGLAVILQQVSGHAWPAIVLSAGAVISVFSVTLVSLYGQTRILFAISMDGLIPQSFREVNPRTLAPVKNIIYVCIVVAIIAGTVHSAYLWDMVSMGTLVAFIAVSLSVPIHRARQKGVKAEGFRLPFGPYLIPGLSIAACLYIIKDLSAATFTVFFIWMALALVAYFTYGIRHSKLPRESVQLPVNQGRKQA
ncbi:amino acid permease [Variovorax sp. J22R133]|uniref:APC family permease n=1 Tax=Variovorax brevis TaxID=3053503 RepID=UPI002576940D|nr:amino acid permease [Variovorax sp. J22R133]MDM0115532.1 amino acid permease [Variovorax sp. J22R133]